jgi:tRNA(Arg) A34 adenosine deaminase TadA
VIAVVAVDDAAFLNRSIELARETMQKGRGGPFGAVIVRAGAIIGEGANCVLGNNDPTAHAEVQAIRDASARERNFILAGAVIYASSEPCPMCLAAIFWARIERIVYANARGVAAAVGFDDSFFYEQLALPEQERAIPVAHLKLDHAASLFEEWRDKADKTPY